MIKRTLKTEAVKSEIKRWWETPRNLRWDKFFDSEDSNSYRMLSRANKVLNYLESLNLKHDAKILELGFGGGQTAKKILEKGYYYEGIDISSQLTECAEERCIKYVKDGKAKFHIGSIDERIDFEDFSFDVIIAVGVFQYVTDIPACFSEIKRVLNRGGHLIVCQTNMYNIQKMLMARNILLCCIYAFGREEFELPPSFKAMLIDSKMGSYFNRFKDTRFFRRKFMVKGHMDYKFGFRKRLFSLLRLSKILDQHKFKVLKKCGSPFFYSVTGRNWRISNVFDSFFQRISDKSIPTLSGFADNVIILAKR